MDNLRYPIGTFDVSQEVKEEQINPLIEQIEALPELLVKATGGLKEIELNTPYRPGGWTIRQLVHHLADSNLNAYIRFKLALTEDKPTIKPYNEAEWAKLTDSQLPIESSLQILAGLHRRWGVLLRTLSREDLRRELIHPETGVLTVKTLIALYAWHGNHHLAQISAGLNRNISS